MKHMLLIAVAAGLTACSPGATAPNPDKVGEQAKASLQQQLEANHADEHLTVQKVGVVSVGGAKFEGTATISGMEGQITAPLAVTSDGKTTIVTLNDLAFEGNLANARQRKLAVLQGKYADYVKDPAIMARFSPSLNREKDQFVRRLETVTPIEVNDDYFFGSGCKTHECGDNEAAWVINRKTGVGTAIVMVSLTKTPEIQANKSFHIYGGTVKTLPDQLVDWANNNGATNGNVVDDVPEYVAPGK